MRHHTQFPIPLLSDCRLLLRALLALFDSIRLGLGPGPFIWLAAHSIQQMEINGQRKRRRADSIHFGEIQTEENGRGEGGRCLPAGWLLGWKSTEWMDGTCETHGMAIFVHLIDEIRRRRGERGNEVNAGCRQAYFLCHYQFLDWRRERPEEFAAFICCWPPRKIFFF